jgi:hypothetical protein
MDLSNVNDAVEIIKRVAHAKIPKEGWTFIITYWEDDTFEIEYRHKDVDEDLYHRFFYKSNRDNPRIKYYLCSYDHMLKGNPPFSYIKSEYIDIGNIQCRKQKSAAG